MATYSLGRNIEASLINFLTDALIKDNWKDIRLTKSFAQVYDGTLPAICVQYNTANATTLELGSGTWLKEPEITIRLFCTSDGQRLDLAAWLLDKLEDSIAYYEYEITSGEISKKTQTGYINVTTIRRDEKEIVNLEPIKLTDKFRHNITFRCRISKI